MIRCCLILFMLLSCGSVLYASECVADGNALLKSDENSCTVCHTEHKNFSKQGKEAKFIKSTFSSLDSKFGEKNCAGCHAESCMDCHTASSGSKVALPGMGTCLNCHNDLYTGTDFIGLGIREDHERYQRGVEFKGKLYMQMLPDIHYEKGMTCMDCHDMKNMAGEKKAKQCADCHSYSRKATDHQIKGHEKVACVSCHGAWAPHEYGSFYIRTVDTVVKEYYRWVRNLNNEYVKSSFMRLNGTFALGVDEYGMYVPIKPKFTVFTTYVYKDRVVGIENEMLSNRWARFTPHTVRKETMLCESCHNNPRKYLLEDKGDRYLLPDKDGLPIGSFYSSEGFRVNDARFVTAEEYKKISDTKSKEYIKYYMQKIEQIKKLL